MQLKRVVVKQMLFREGSVHGSVNFSCPRFFLLLNMNDVDGFLSRRSSPWIFEDNLDFFVDFPKDYITRLPYAAFPLQGAVRFGSPQSGREGAV